MISLLLILIPLLGGIFCFLLKQPSVSKSFSLFVFILVLVLSLLSIPLSSSSTYLFYDASWIPALSTRFTLWQDGMAKLLIGLTAFAFPVAAIATSSASYKKPERFFGFMLLMEAGLIGVFLAADVLLFYFFWELALIPAYFLSSIWGGERRVAATFKFFIYTFTGSLLMLVGILYVYFQMPQPSFSLQAFYNNHLSSAQQNFAFWLFFIAFAIKMPVFPFHTWQPDTYEQSPYAVTMILSGVMVKMGLYGVVRWLIPVFPQSSVHFSHFIIVLNVIGILYASLIAMRQNDIKRLIAYSSIAHIGMMCAAIFSSREVGVQGVMIQMLSHGVNVIGMWIVADAIEKQTGTRKFTELGGLAQRAPSFAVLFMLVMLANIALPLTNAFIGEFLMLNGLFQYNFWVSLLAGISIILAPVYLLNMMQKVFYGKTVAATENASESSASSQWMLGLIIMIVLVTGIFPQPVLNLANDTVKMVIARFHLF